MLYILPPLENSKNELVDDGPRADLPADFDCRQYPILAQHWFGWDSVGAVAARVVQDITFRREAQHLQ